MKTFLEFVNNYRERVGDNGKTCEDGIEECLKKVFDIVISQPNGCQSFPDFKIISSGLIYEIESKSSKNGMPMWNTALPKKNAIYVFTRLNDSNVTYSLGGDLIADEERNEIKSFWYSIEDQYIEFNKKLNNGNYLFHRRMYQPRAGRNPFKGEIKEREKKVHERFVR